MTLKNKGLFLETIINQSISRLLDYQILVQKMPIDSTLISIENNVIKSRLKINNFCDYNGIFKGKYFEFDAKETELDYFSLFNLKEKQRIKLELIHRLGGLAFIIIYFHKNESFYVLDWNEIKNNNVKKIPLQWFIENGNEIFYTNLTLRLDHYLNRLVSCI